MQDEVLKRAMFSQPMTKASRNSGIMAGFDENMEDMQPEEPEEQMSPMARTPQNPEILMNTLRGDMRSVDARVQELAQMVGEQAAQETPPEVLALLQAQLAAPQMPQGGIGALPQTPMMPPQGMPPAPQGAGPQAPVGAPPFPQGASAPQQFSHGGAVEPPTPDGLPPMHAFLGAFVNPMARYAQMGADKAAMLGQEANIIGGRLMTQGFPQQFPGILENLRGPNGRFISEQVLKYPTLTQHLSNVGANLAEKYPRVAGAVDTLTHPVVAAAGTLGASIPIINSMAPSVKRSPEEEAKFQELLARIPTTGEFPVGTTPPAAPPAAEEPPPVPSGAKKPAVPVEPAAVTGEKTTDQFIKDQTKPAAGANLTSLLAPSSAKTDVESIREKYKEYGPLFKEILGDNNEDMRANAMLLLADAGFRYASARPTPGSTPVTIFAEAVSDLPKGVASLVAQARDRKVKIDTAALSQAITDVSTEKKALQTLKSDIIKGDYRLLLEQIRQGGGTLEDGGAGLVIAKTPKGSYAGVSIDPKHPTVQSAVTSRWTLNDTNPFVEFRGPAPTAVETDKGERVKLSSSLHALDGSLATLENLKGVYAGAYGPGAWFNDKVNNLFVPVLPSAVVRPDVDLVDAKTRINTGLNSIIKNIAAANDSGRVAVQEQEWARKTAEDVSNPTAFFQDKELAAKQFNSMESMLRNARQQVLTQLGYESNDYVMRSPNTGTKSDPFIIPTDPTTQKQMFNFLGNSLGKLQQPNATVYLRLPNNTIQAFNPGQLRELVK